jgi:hypothetical protein
VSFTFDLQSVAMFDSYMPCCACAMPQAWHGICELASDVQRQHVGDLPMFGFFQLPHRVPRRLLISLFIGVGGVGGLGPSSNFLKKYDILEVGSVSIFRQRIT